MAKLLTAVVAEDLSRLVEKHQLLPNTHFGGRPGRTTMDAIHYLADKIKCAWREGKVVSILFLDVEGAFPNAVKERLIHNMKKRRIPKAYVDFVEQLLTGRMTKLQFDDFVSELMTVDNGIGQGDPLSMILYIIYNADLLEIADVTEREDALGYVDNVAVMAVADDFDETVTMLKHMMEKEDGGQQWSDDHNSRFEVSKSVVLHATRRRQKDPANRRRQIPLDRPPLILQGQVVREVESFKYLGIEIDSELCWQAQMQRGLANATKWVQLFRRLTRPSTGINAKLMRRLYISVALPKMTYALDTWYTPPTKPEGCRRSKGSSTFLKKITSLQRKATLAITGGLPSTATDVLDAHAGILPMELTLLKICHRATLRLCTLPETHPLHVVVEREARTMNNDQAHQGAIKQLLRIFELKPDNLEKISPETSDPARPNNFTIRITETREESMKIEEEDNSDIKMYTDGSGHDNRVGAAAVMYLKGALHPIKTLRLYLGTLSEHTTYEGEATGGILAMWLLEHHPGIRGKRVTVYTDSQAFLQGLDRRKGKPAQHLVQAFLDAANNLPCQLRLRWISAHSEVPGNEKADEEAKEAANGNSSPTDSLPPYLRIPLPRSAAAEKQAYHAELKEMWCEDWEKSIRKERMDRIDAEFPFNKYCKMRDGLTRAQGSLLTQIRSGHIPLNAHLKRIGKSETENCQACTGRRGAIPAKETVTHFLFDCPAYMTEREKMNRKLGRHAGDLKLIMSTIDGIKELLRFVGETKRLRNTLGDVTPQSEEGNEY